MIACVISDIHANWEALSAVVREIDAIPHDSLYCLGDLVGYNADPDACVSRTLSTAAVTVRGNHDKAAAGLFSLEWFNPLARAAAIWTRKNAKPDTLETLAGLAQGPIEVEEGLLLCHGAPMDEDRYIYNDASVRESFECLAEEYPETRVCFHGHTHIPFAARLRGRTGRTEILPAGEEIGLEEGSTYLINPGSVGQPRDGNPWASFGILDTKRWTYRTMRVIYDAARTGEKIKTAGLPKELACRLAEGR
jgi:predicted phosphodiesterase